MQTFTDAMAEDITFKAQNMSIEEQMAYLKGFSMDCILQEINRRKDIQDRKSMLLRQLDELEREEKGR